MNDKSAEAALSEAIEALSECEEYFDNRADADCDQDGFIPNKEMRLLSVVRTALQALENGPAGLADATNDPAESDLSSLRKGAEEGLTALMLVRSIIVEAAMTGFNCHDGDWAERLYVSQAASHEAVKNLRAALVSGSREDGA